MNAVNVLNIFQLFWVPIQGFAATHQGIPTARVIGGVQVRCLELVPSAGDPMIRGAIGEWHGISSGEISPKTSRLIRFDEI